MAFYFWALKYSGEIDLKFGAESIEQFADFGSKGIFRPSSELAPVIFGLLPKDFDHVQFRTVRRQVAKEGIEFLHPAQGHAVVEVVMNTGIVENDEGRYRLGNLRNQTLHEIDKGFAVDRGRCLSVMQTLPGKVQCPHHRDALVMRRRHCMRTTERRPGALYGRRSRESRLVVIEQLATAIPCPSLQAGKFGRAGGKSFRVAVFFRLMRVRLKLNPLFLRMTPSRSSDSGKGAP